MIRLICLLLPMLASTAWSNPVTLKDAQFKAGPENTMMIQHGSETAQVESLGNQRYRINGVVLALNATDTLQSATQKLRQAYVSSKKKNALLDSLFIQEAHAAPPIWFTLLFGGMIGAGIGRATCPSSSPAGGSFQGTAN